MNDKEHKNHIELFDSSHNYESGNFSEVKDKLLNLIIEVLHTFIPSDVEYDFKVNSSDNFINVEFGKRQPELKYDDIKKSINDALREKGLKMTVNFYYTD